MMLQVLTHTQASHVEPAPLRTVRLPGPVVLLARNRRVVAGRLERRQLVVWHRKLRDQREVCRAVHARLPLRVAMRLIADNRVP